MSLNILHSAVHSETSHFEMLHDNKGSRTENLVDDETMSPRTTDVARVVEPLELSQEDGAEEKHSAAFYLAYATLLLGLFMVPLEVAIVSSALTSIAKDLNTTSNKAFWVGTAYILAQTVTQPLFGSISEIFGRKIMIQISLLIFLLGSILCSRAQNIDWLIATRVVQGIGGAGIATLSTITVVDMTTVRERAKFVAGLSISYSLGYFGLVLGAVFGEFSTWRWIFYINIPICVLCLIGIHLFLHLSLKEATFRDRLGQLDWLGSFIFVASLTSFLVAVSDGASNSWSSPSVLAPLIIGICGLMLFTLYEVYIAKAPMLALAAFEGITPKIAYFSSFVVGVITVTGIYYLTVYFLGGVGLSQIHSGINVLPVALMATAGAILGGILVRRLMSFKICLLLGWIFASTGVGLFVVLQPTSTLGEQVGFQTLTGIGVGMLLLNLQLCAQSGLPDELHSVSANVIGFFRSLGFVFGIAIGATIFQKEFTRNVNEKIMSGDLDSSSAISGELAESSYSIIDTLPTAGIYRQIYTDSLRPLWYLVLALSITALLVSFLTKDISLNRGFKSTQKFTGGKSKNSSNP